MEHDLVVGLPLGVCVKHNASKISINGLPTCLRCHEAESKAVSVSAGVNTYEDPGEDGLKNIGVAAIGVVKPSVIKQAPVSNLSDVITALKALPMPKTMAEFRNIQKAIQLLEKSLGV